MGFGGFLHFSFPLWFELTGTEWCLLHLKGKSVLQEAPNPTISFKNTYFVILFIYFWLPWISVTGLFATCGEEGLLSRSGTWASH